MRILSNLGLVAALFSAAPAFAHPKLVAASPEANAIVGRVASVRLSFSEALMPRLSGATLTRTGMPGVAKHADMKVTGVKTTVAGKAIQLVSAKALPPGSYRVDWHLVGGDTHRITGTHSFTVR